MHARRARPRGTHAAAIATGAAKIPAAAILEAQRAEIRRLRADNARLRETLRKLRLELAALYPLKKQLQRVRTACFKQRRRAELWKARALRK